MNPVELRQLVEQLQPVIEQLRPAGQFVWDSSVSSFAIYGGFCAAKGTYQKLRKRRDKKSGKGKIGKLELFGPIVPDSSKIARIQGPAIFPKAVKKGLEAAKEANVEGLLLHISSPGGSPGPSQEIGDMIKEVEVPIMAYVDHQIASGGYWIASACDEIVANPYSTVGCIGVFAQHISVADLIKKLGIEVETFTTCDYKDMGSPFRKFSEEEKEILYDNLFYIHEGFVEEVAANREMGMEDVYELANGLVYLAGKDALEEGLIDLTGNEDTAIKRIESLGEFEHKQVVDFTPRKKKGPLRSLLGISSPYGFGYNVGVSVVQGMIDAATNHNQTIR